MSFFKKKVSSHPKSVMRAVDQIMEENPHIFSDAPPSDKRQSRRHEGAHAFGIFLSGINSVDVSFEEGSFTLDYQGFQDPDQQEFTAKAPELLDKRYKQKLSDADFQELARSYRARRK